jgi:hypothetical protein
MEVVVLPARTKTIDQTGVTEAKAVMTQLAILGLIESSYSRSKAIGYIPVHTWVFVGRNGNVDLSGVDLRVRKIGFDPLPTPHHHDKLPNVRFTSYVNPAGISLLVHHSMEGEVVTVTLQYLAD